MNPTFRFSSRGPIGGKEKGALSLAALGKKCNDEPNSNQLKLGRSASKTNEAVSRGFHHPRPDGRHGPRRALWLERLPWMLPRERAAS